MMCMDTTHPDLAAKAPRPATDGANELRRLGEYQVLRRLGEGGMGSVYLTYHEGQKTCFAIKVLADSLSFNQNYVDRFYREARSGAMLQHPNIVRCLTVGQDQATGKHYMVMEYVDGPSVQVLMEKQGKLPIGDAVHIALDIARGLEHAHSRNIVHRDIKPGNILISPSGVAKLADLGLAKRTDEASHLTATRQTFGTPHYMPYEQAVNSRTADNRSDIFALGATLYHLVTGELPFQGENHLDLVEKKERGAFRAASNLVPEVPTVLDKILAQMLARQPRRRYQTASELIIALERSQLATPMLSFTDPALAMQDPQVRARLTIDNQPTMLDMRRANPEPVRAVTPAQRWLLRYRDKAGTLRRYRASTEQITRHLRAGRLPRNMEARPAERNSPYRPLPAYPEFEAVVAARPKVSKKVSEQSAPKDPPAESAGHKERPLHPETKRLIGIISVMIAFCFLVWLTWRLIH
jgi:eukaryotic-like serine/threonine-protein kinase